MNRREFITGAVAVAASSVVPSTPFASTPFARTSVRFATAEEAKLLTLTQRLMRELKADMEWALLRNKEHWYL